MTRAGGGPINVSQREDIIKKTLAISLLIIILTLGLTACEGGSVSTAGNDSTTAGTSSTEAATQEKPEIPLTQGGNTADAGDFTVYVPEGWLGSGDLDTDEDGNYFIEPYYYILIKGGETSADQGLKPRDQGLKT